MINAISRRDALSANLAVVKWQTSQVEKGLACLTGKQRRILELFYIRREYGYIHGFARSSMRVNERCTGIRTKH